MSTYPPAGPPPGYQSNPYGGGYSPQSHPQGTTILVLGILSLVICGLLGPVAWIMGNKAIKEVDANPGRYSNRGTVQAGRILGAIASALLVLGIIVAIVLVASSSGSSSS